MSKPEPGSRPTGSPNFRPIFRLEDVERATTEYGKAIHAAIAEQARREATMREGQVFTWLRQNWPWWARWAIGYPRAIAALDRLGLVPLPVFVAGHAIGEEPQQLKASTNGGWTVQVYGREVKLQASAYCGVYVRSPEGEYRSVDVPLQLRHDLPPPWGQHGRPVLVPDWTPVIDAIDELRACGAMERERELAERDAACDDEGHIFTDSRICERCENYIPEEKPCEGS